MDGPFYVVVATNDKPHPRWGPDEHGACGLGALDIIANVLAAEVERLRSELEEARRDALRWREFVSIAIERGGVDLPNVDITYTPSGYNGGQWSTMELCWKHPQWAEWTKEHADAAIDAAIAAQGAKT